MELNPNALTTPERLKTMLGINPADDDHEDELLVLMINQLSAWIERQLGRNLAKSDYRESVKPSGDQSLIVEHYPILAVASIAQNGMAIDPSAYDIENTGAHGEIYKDDGWTYSGYPYGLSGDPIAARRNLLVHYTAGYVLPKDATPSDPATLPADIEGLLWEMAQSAYGRMQSGGNAGLKSFAISDVRWEFLNEIPQAWNDVLQAHKRYWL